MVQIMDSATIRQELIRIMEEQSLSQDKVGKAIAYSGSSISLYLKGSYSGNLKEMETRLRGFIERTRSRAKVMGRQVPFVPLGNWKVFNEIARLSHLECELGVVVGEAGTGKTMAAREYARRDSTVVYLEANLSFTTRVFFGLLCEALDLSSEGNLNSLVERVKKKLTGSKRLLIIDQAEYLPFRALDLLRTVYDSAEVGMVLVGLPRLEHNLKAAKGSHAQIYSRVAVFQRLKNSLTLPETRAIVESRLGEGADVEALHAYSSGNTRTLDKLIRRSKWIAQNNNMEIDAEVVREASGMLMA